MGSITCEPKVLADALAAVKAAVWTKSAVNAHAGVRITSNGTGITLSTSNMDLFIKRELPGEWDGNLDVCVNHAELVKVAKAFARAENLTLGLNDDKLECSSGSRTVSLALLRIEDLPGWPNLGGTEILKDVNGTYLANAIERVAKFASKDETRPVLTGVYLDQEPNGELSLVATDSYRLCVRTLTGLPAWGGGFNVPARELVAAAKLMRKEENVTLRAYGQELANGYAIIIWPGTTIAIRLCQGQYPDYRQLMPESWPNVVKIPISELRAGADLAVQFLTKNTPLHFHVNGVVKLHGHVPDGPSFEEILTGAKTSVNEGALKALPENTPRFPQNGEGFDFEIGFCPEYLRDIAQSLEGKTAIVNLISPLRPALIHSEDESERHLLMPIRLSV